MPQTRDISVPSRDELGPVLNTIIDAASAYLGGLDQMRVRAQGLHERLEAFDSALPEIGSGAVSTLETLVHNGLDAAIQSSGPRFFHFITGGTTPAALGADWMATTLDQMAYAWVASPLAAKLEAISLSWLKDLFGLPLSWGGTITTGTTMANFVGLAAARQWWGEQHGVDVAEQGLVNLPRLPIFASDIIHPSTLKALGMMGLGRSSVTKLAQGTQGLFNTRALARHLQDLNGEPAIILATAGEPNAGAFDPVAQLAELAHTYNAWLHVDGAFGLFARLAPSAAHHIDGVALANSVTVDGHKWLNVPYDCGFVFLNEPMWLGKVFSHSADYLPDPTDKEPVMGTQGPEMSRRARALPVWATLRAYGRTGITAMIKKHLALAQYLAGRVDEAPNLERLADVPLNVVCFRYNPGAMEEEALNRINQAIGAAILEDGRIYMGTTRYDGKVAFRPAIVNWRTCQEDVQMIVDIVQEFSRKFASFQS